MNLLFNKINIFICSLFLFNTVYAGLSPSPTPDNINQIEAFTALTDSCFAAGTSSEFNSDCSNALFGGDEDTLSALTPDEIISNNTNITSGSINNTFARLSTLRNAGGGGSADVFTNRLGVYSSGHSAWQEYDGQGLNPGFIYFDSKAMVGADYRFTDNVIAGLMASFIGSDSDLHNNAGNIESDGYSFAAYGSFFLDDSFYIDATFAYSGQTHDTSRNIFYNTGTQVNQVASADVDSDTYSAGISAGYNFYVEGFTITPTMRWMYRDIQLEGYTESMSNPNGPGGTLGLTIGDQEYESLTGNFGVQVSYALSQSWGVLVPSISGEFVHEFANDSEQFNVRYTNSASGSGAFTLSTTKLDSDYATLSASVSAQFTHGVSAFLNYEKILGLSNLTSDAVSMGIRLDL